MLCGTLSAQFEAVAARHSDRPAVKTGERALSYGELNTTANRLARAILDRAGPPPTVGLLLEHGVSLALGVLGCLKAGKAYVPLEVASPPDRQARILADADATLLVTDTAAAAPPGRGLEVLRLDALSPDLPAHDPGIRLGPDDLACVLYTSGSTGMPKGVMCSHGMILARVVGFNRFGVGPGDRVSALGAGGMNLFRALLRGATLVSLDVRREGIEILPGWLRYERITLYHSVPTLFRHLIGVLTGDEMFPDLRVVNLTGESLLAQDVAAFRRHFADPCVLVHGLGTTEAGTFQELRIDRGTRIVGRVVPVGFSVEGTDALLLDASGRPAEPGQIGEIAVRSEHLAAGYWKRPDLTAASFLPDPDGGARRVYRTGDLGRFLADGSLAHLGRDDFQIKVRGHRVEVGEVESALLDHPGVCEAAVVGRPVDDGGTRLLGYAVARRDAALSARDLRAFLRDRLPDYMIPSVFVILGALPLLPNGKVDRQALPDPPPDGPRAPAPLTDAMEALLVEVFADVLHVGELGVHDDFFALGGDSLQAGQIASRLRERLAVDVPLATILERPTVSELAVAVVDLMAHSGDPTG